MLRVREVARRLSCSVSCVYTLISSGQLKHHRLGVGRGTIRVTEQQLSEFLAGTEKEGRPAPLPLKHISLDG